MIDSTILNNTTEGKTRGKTSKALYKLSVAAMLLVRCQHRLRSKIAPYLAFGTTCVSQFRWTGIQFKIWWAIRHAAKFSAA